MQALCGTLALGALAVGSTLQRVHAEADPGPPLAAPAGELQRSAARIETDVRFLADDLLEGREAGTRLAEGARFAITRDGQTKELRFKEEFLPGVPYNGGSCDVTAPMVFVGQAVRAPELKHDDFAGVDVRGTVTVILWNAPGKFPNDQRAFYADGLGKLGELERRGAVGKPLDTFPGIRCTATVPSSQQPCSCRVRASRPSRSSHAWRRAPCGRSTWRAR